MTHSSKKAWTMIKKLSGDPTTAEQHHNVTPDQIAHQLLLNGKPPTKQHKTKFQCRCEVETTSFTQPFSQQELEAAIKKMLPGKAAGLDDICTEQIVHFGPVAHSWLLQLFNTCKETNTIPRAWRQARVVAILKPGKDPSSSKSFRPISLLCHLHKLYEQIILNRLIPIIDPQLISEQAGFRPGKSCIGQILNLTQHIEDGFERGSITSAVLVDLTAAYDTVNHRRLIAKIYELTRDHHLITTIQTLLQNRQFFVVLGRKRSRLRTQKNGLPQGSVLAPLLFNIYTNDQPIHLDTSSFIFADDLAVTSQSKDFTTVGNTLTDALTGHTKPTASKPSEDSSYCLPSTEQRCCETPRRHVGQSPPRTL